MSIVQSINALFFQGTQEASYPSPVTGGNALYVSIYVEDAAEITLSDSQNNTWTPVAGLPEGSQAWVAFDVPAGETTLQFGGFGAETVVFLLAFEASDLTGVNASGGTASGNSVALTTTAAPCLVVTLGATYGAGIQAGPESTAITLVEAFSVGFMLEQQVAASAGAITSTFLDSSGGTNVSALYSVALAIGSVTPPTPTPEAPFAAVFGDGLVEQVIALVQANQGAAIEAFGPTQFTGANGQMLDPIVDFHKGPISSPQYPCLTVTAGTPVPELEGLENVAEYHIRLTLWLDINYMDPEQLADWSLKYFTLFFNMWMNITDKYGNLSPFTTPMNITWPGPGPSGVASPRITKPPAAGTVKQLWLSWQNPGELERNEESNLPVKIRLPFELTFHMMEI